MSKPTFITYSLTGKPIKYFFGPHPEINDIKKVISQKLELTTRYIRKNNIFIRAKL